MPFPTRVNVTASSTWTATPGLTYASSALNVTAGNTLIVAAGGVESAFGEYVASVTDTAGNTYAKVDHITGAGHRVEIWYATNVIAHASNVVTATWTAAVGYRGIIVAQYVGLDVAGPFDAVAKGTAPSGPLVTTSTLTTTKWDELHLLLPRWGYLGTTTFPTGFTQVSPDANALMAERIVSGPPFVGPYSITHTSGSTFEKSAIAVAFAPVQTPPPARVGQVVVEVVSSPTGDARVGQFVVETLSSPTPDARIGQFVVETVSRPVPASRVGQFLVEVLTGPVIVTGLTIPSGSQVFPPSALGGTQAVTVAPLGSTATLFPPSLTVSDAPVVGAFIGSTVLLGPPHVLPEYPRVTQAGAEVADLPTPGSRTTQAGVDLAGLLTPSSRATAVGAEIVDTLTPRSRVTVVGAEVVYGLLVPGRLTTGGLEVAWVVPRKEVLLAEGTVGLTWCEFTSRDLVMRPWSTVALPDPLGYYGGFKEPRVTEWGRITRALSEMRSGQMEGMEFTVVLSDSDRLIRQLLAQASTKYFVNRPLVVRMIDDDARRALETPRTVMRGLISGYQPMPQLQFQMTAQDVMTRKFAQSQGGVDVPKRLVTLDDFTHANDAIMQMESSTVSYVGAVGKAVPIIYGAAGDRQLVTTTIPVGVPLPIDPALPWHHFHSNDAGGGVRDEYGGGSITGWCTGRIAAVIAGKETDTYPGNPGALGATGPGPGVEVSAPRAVWFWFNQYPGAESYRIYLSPHGGWDPHRGVMWFTEVPVGYGRMITHDNVTMDGGSIADMAVVIRHWTDGVDVLGGGSTTTVTNDMGKGIIKPIYVGDYEFSGAKWRGALICGHAVKAIYGYMNDKAVDLTTSPEWLTPMNWAWWTSMTGSFGWDWTKPYLDINGRRYTLIFLRGVTGDIFAGVGKNEGPEGGATPTGVTVNIDGIEDIGDGSGALITDIHQQYKHLVKHWVLSNYQTGNWATQPDPLYPDTDAIPQYDAASFDKASDIAKTRIAGGYVGAGVIGTDGEVMSVRDLIAQWNQSADVESGFNRHGQLFVSMLPDSGVSDILLTDVHDLNRDSFEIVDDLSSHFNNMPYSYAYDYSGRAQAGHDNQFMHVGELSDQRSIDNYEARLRAPELEMWYVRDGPTALDIIQRRLLRMKDPPRFATFAVGVEGANYELGDILNLTHYGGIGPDGWIAQPLRIIRHEFDPNRLEIMIECMDMKQLFELPFILGNETMLPATWTDGDGRTADLWVLGRRDDRRVLGRRSGQEITLMPVFQDLTGQVFGKLTVLRLAPKHGARTAWFCRCMCGRRMRGKQSNALKQALSVTLRPTGM